VPNYLMPLSTRAAFPAFIVGRSEENKEDATRNKRRFTMPLSTTNDAIRSILKADPTVAPRERAAIIAAMREGPAECKQATPSKAKIMRRHDVAEALGRSTRTVDNLAAEGLLRRVKLPGRKRACGFRAEDVEALLRDCAA